MHPLCFINPSLQPRTGKSSPKIFDYQLRGEFKCCIVLAPKVICNFFKKRKEKRIEDHFPLKLKEEKTFFFFFQFLLEIIFWSLFLSVNYSRVNLGHTTSWIICLCSVCQTTDFPQGNAAKDYTTYIWLCKEAFSKTNPICCNIWPYAGGHTELPKIGVAKLLF